MDFKEKIEAHNNGTYNFVEELIDLALTGEGVKTKIVKKYVTYGNDYDMEIWRPKYSVKEDKPEHYIAIKLKSILERHAKKALTLKAGHEIDDEIIDVYYYGLLGVGLHYSVDQADKITKEEVSLVEENLGYWDSHDWLYSYNHYKEYALKVNKEKQKYYAEIVPLMKKALEEAITLVDVTLVDKQIVKYINEVTTGKTYKELTKLLGSRLFRIGKNRYFVNEFHLNQFDPKVILEIKDKKFIKSQQDFIDELVALVKLEFDKNNDEPFTLNPSGEPIDINKRYFAKKMGFEESAFKKRLARVQDTWRLNTRKTILLEKRGKS